MSSSATSQRTNCFLVLGVLPAAVAPFVAFTDHYVPVTMTLDPSFAALAAPFLLGVPLAAWQVRRCFVRPSAPWERQLVYALATASALTNLLLIGLLLWLWPLFGLLVLPVPIICAALLGRLLRKAPAAEIPSAALALAYLAHVTVPLVVFSQEPAAPLGWWLTLVATLAVIAQLTLIVRHTRAARSATALMSRTPSAESLPAELL